jgi:hypothetical protein
VGTFVEAHPEIAWQRGARAIRGTAEDGIDVVAEPRWWGRQWTITTDAAFPIPERVIVFVSARGMEHGFWRDLPVGDRTFDSGHFIFCDTPALLPIVLGPATRAAMHDDLTLYIRDGRVRTTGTAKHDDRDAVARHLAIHRGLAADHRAFLEGWRDRIERAHGRADLTWPPTATLLRPSGTLSVNLWWTAPTTRDASDWEQALRSLRTEVTGHDDRKRRSWSMREVGATVPCTHVLADRRFVLAGEVSLALPQLEGLAGRGGLASVVVASHRVTVALPGLATSSQLEAAVRLVQLVIDATAQAGSPYR